MITNEKKKQAGQTVQPGTQDGQWKDQLDDTIAKILNREQFSYDMDSDAMFEQMKDQYIRQGQMAAMDTMGRAATMTGGYGNSYAQGVGQQAYQEYLQGFNDTMPDLYQMALDAYTREGQALGDKYAVLADKRGDELEAAELAASLGDYSLLAKYYGWTDDYMDGLVNPKEESGYSDGGTYNGGGGNNSGGNSDGAGDNPENNYREIAWKALDSRIHGAPHTYASIVQEYITLKKNGATSRETDPYLRQAVAEGLITQDQANELRHYQYEV